MYVCIHVSMYFMYICMHACISLCVCMHLFIFMAMKTWCFHQGRKQQFLCCRPEVAAARRMSSQLPHFFRCSQLQAFRGRSMCWSCHCWLSMPGSCCVRFSSMQSHWKPDLFASRCRECQAPATSWAWQTAGQAWSRSLSGFSMSSQKREGLKPRG